MTSVPCKVIESLIKDVIVKHLEQDSIISNKQHGLVAKKAYVPNMLETVDFFTGSMSRRQPADVIYLDFVE